MVHKMNMKNVIKNRTHWTPMNGETNQRIQTMTTETDNRAAAIAPTVTAPIYSNMFCLCCCRKCAAFTREWKRTYGVLLSSSSLCYRRRRRSLRSHR